MTTAGHRHIRSYQDRHVRSCADTWGVFLARIVARSGISRTAVVKRVRPSVACQEDGEFRPVRRRAPRRLQGVGVHDDPRGSEIEEPQTAGVSGLLSYGFDLPSLQSFCSARLCVDCRVFRWGVMLTLAPTRGVHVAELARHLHPIDGRLVPGSEVRLVQEA